MGTGKKIMEYLDANGILHLFLAKKIGMSHSLLSQKLNGVVRISLDEYERICWALSVPINKFLTPHP